MSFISKIPLELWFNIFRYTDLITISKMCCINKKFNNMIYSNLWSFVDAIYKNSDVLIPKNELTYNRYIYVIDWSEIIMHCKNYNKSIPENTIMWIPDNRDLGMIVSYQTLSDNLIRSLYTRIPTTTLLSKQKVPIDILYNIISSQEISIMDWYNIWLSQDIDLDFLEENIDNVQWHPLSSNKSIISIDFISRYSDNIIWQEFTKHSIHEDILECYIHHFDFICWNNICTFTQLSINFIKRHFDKLSNPILIRFQELSEELIDEILYSDDVSTFDFELYIQSIASYQKVSKQFILDNMEFISKKSLIRNKRIPRLILHQIFG